MSATKIPRFGGIVRVIGFILAIPSILGLLFSAFMFIVLLTTNASMPAAQSDGEMVGQAIGNVVFGGFVLAIAAGSLVSGLIGWLLLLTRKVFKCRRCGFVLDRA